jgi:ADP-ribose pyrophosphatase
MAQSDDAPPGGVGAQADRVRLVRRERVYDGFFSLDQVTLSYRRDDGDMSAPITRLVFERGDAVALLPYDPQSRSVVLVRQFRHAAWVRGGPGWLWEVVAGIWDAGRSAADVARSEALEEAGYVLGALRHVATFYPSPGACSERIYLYLAPITPASRVNAGGGLDQEGEDTMARSFGLDEALAMAADGRICDGKTIIALQFLALHWSEIALS